MNKILSIICLYIIIIHQTYGQWQQIKSKELEGGFTASEIAVHKGKLYVIKNNTIYTSSDKGKSWDYLTSNLPQKALNIEYYNPNPITLMSDGKDLYASSTYAYLYQPQYSNVYKSSDDGKNWIKIFNGTLAGIAEGKIFAIAYDSTVTGENFYKNRLYFSEGGKNWTKSFLLGDYNYLFSKNGFPLCFSNHSNEILYSKDGIHTDTLKTFHSTNGNYHFKIGNYIFISDSWIDNKNEWYLELHRINLQDNTDKEVTEVITNKDSIRSFAIAEPYIFATTSSNSVYKIWRSENNGDSWETIFSV